MSEDTIKRSDAIKALCKLGHEVVVIDKVCSLGVATEFIDAIRAIPSADRPQGEWIPCSERLPSGEDAVLVSTCAFDAIYDVVFMRAEDVGRFYECGHVNAWMPSPEPWKGADDERFHNRTFMFGHRNDSYIRDVKGADDEASD